MKNSLIPNWAVAPRFLHEFVDLTSENRGAHYIIQGLIWLVGLKLLDIAFNYHIERH